MCLASCNLIKRQKKFASIQFGTITSAAFTYIKNEKQCVLTSRFAIQTVILLHKMVTGVFVPTFVTKVTEYLCSGCFFFLQINFDFSTSQFFPEFF